MACMSEIQIQTCNSNPSVLLSRVHLQPETSTADIKIAQEL